MRCFFALWPDTETALRIADWRDRHAPCSGRSVPPACLHITLAFLGEVPQRSIAALCDAVDARQDLAGTQPREGDADDAVASAQPGPVP